MEEFGQADVSQQILPALVGVGPRGALQDHLAPQFVGDTEALDGTEACYAVTPVLVLGFAHGSPVARHVRSDAAGDHLTIVALSRRGTDYRL